jgi:protoheme IX farnesyltransferase
MDVRAAAHTSAQRSRLATAGRRCALYLELSKARLSALVVLTTAAGFLLASEPNVDWSRLWWTLIGTALVAGGANGMNQLIERRQDARMERTRRRPLPSGQLNVTQAGRWAAAACILGTALLTALTNPLTGLLALFALVIYVLVYTPLKTRTSLCTLVGAVVGAVPPMMGWTSAAGALGHGAWVLGAVLFVWQIPHFLALGWLYRADYERGGFRMLPVIDRTGRLTCLAVVLYSLALLPAGLAAMMTGLIGWVAAAGSLLLGLALSVLAIRLYHQRTNTSARRLFLASVIYLSVLLGLMVADRRPNEPTPFLDGRAVAQSQRPSPFDSAW